MIMPKKDGFDKDEQEFINSYEKGDWKSVPNIKKVIKDHQEIVQNTIRKNKNINIRLTQFDLNGIKSKAIQEGMPYQTLIASILHKYVTGTLIPKQ